MKKLLGSVLALALVLSISQANAELLKNFKFGGSIDLQATSARNVLDFQTHPKANNGGDQIGNVQTRLMLNMDWDLLDDVHSRVTIRKNDRVWGSRTADTTPQDVNTVTTLLFVDEANVKIDKVFGYVDTTLGRQFYGEEGDLIIYYGPRHNQYGMNVDAIDAAKFDYNGEKLYVSVLAANQSNGAAGRAIGNTAAAYNGRKDLRGLVVGTKGMENVDGKFYLYNAETHRFTTGLGADDSKNDNLYIAGIKAKAKFGGAFVSGEFAQNFGDYRVGAAPGNNARYCGWAVKLDGGMKAEVANIGTFSPWGNFSMGTGRDNSSENQNAQFVSINTDFRPGAIYGRFDRYNVGGLTFGSQINNGGAPATNPASDGLSNRVIWGVGVKANPAAVSKLTAGVSYWDFKFFRMTKTATAPGVQDGQGNRHIGSEIDLDAEWKHSENVSFRAGVGTFQPGGFIKEYKRGITRPAEAQDSENPALLSYFDVAIKF
ncbi:MAG TPA: hypothetical protein DEB40_03505 [Elusimicrobia bacterium]|nr:hypothetical protein [Elusimicrobiota bacterium]HBT60795.1 hypothetical protein [Elusimicrobiota bacterium]